MITTMSTSMMQENITIDDFAKCDIRIGEILTAGFVEGADKLVVFTLDLGETTADEEGNETKKIRQILSGIREYYPEPSELVGKQVPVLCNLPVRKLRGLESEGMILYTVGEGENFKALTPVERVANGTKIS